jgi:hypothetical protein
MTRQEWRQSSHDGRRELTRIRWAWAACVAAALVMIGWWR